MVASKDSSLIDSTKPEQPSETVSKISNDLSVDESFVDKSANENVFADETINFQNCGLSELFSVGRLL